jgi:hypothetical protein
MRDEEAPQHRSYTRKMIIFAGRAVLALFRRRRLRSNNAWVAVRVGGRGWCDRRRLA